MAQIRKAAVLGAGVMGTAIAAHLTNAGVPCMLLDMVPTDASGDPKDRNRLAAGAMQHARKASPAPFAHKDRARMITVGNFEDDLERLSEVDWVVESCRGAYGR